MITDRLTARVLGVVVLLLALLIDSSCFIFVKPEVRARPAFPVIVMVPSLPLFAIGAFLLRKAGRMKDEEEEAGGGRPRR